MTHHHSIGRRTGRMSGILRYAAASVRTAVCVLAMASASLNAQAQELEYAMEVGLMGGGSFYLGDANYSGFYKNLCPAGGAFARWNINPRMAVKFNALYAGLKGDIRSSETKYPPAELAKVEKPSFSNSAVDVSATYELHFWGFGTGAASYKGNKRWCPYIQLGLGGTYANKAFTMNIPIGCGVKFKVKDRLNVGLDWAMHFTLSDELDGVKDPYRIESGFLKNKDSYCVTSIYISYDFCPKLRKCPSVEY